MANHRFNPENADKLMSDKRRTELQPDKLLKRLEVGKGDVVADLGSGLGLFTIPIAEETEQMVYAVDIESEMLERLKKNAEEKHIENIEYVSSDLEEIQLDDRSMNRALNAFVIHEIPDMNQAISEMKRILKPGELSTIGRLGSSGN